MMPTYKKPRPHGVGYVWIRTFFLPDTASVHSREFDSDTLRVDGGSFEFGEKGLRIQKYPDTSGKGLSSLGVIVHEMYPE